MANLFPNSIGAIESSPSRINVEGTRIVVSLGDGRTVKKVFSRLVSEDEKRRFLLEAIHGQKSFSWVTTPVVRRCDLTSNEEYEAQF